MTLNFLNIIARYLMDALVNDEKRVTECALFLVLLAIATAIVIVMDHKAKDPTKKASAEIERYEVFTRFRRPCVVNTLSLVGPCT